MEKNTAGIVIFLVGIFVFLQSYSQQQSTAKITFLIVGIGLVIGGLWYATKK